MKLYVACNSLHLSNPYQFPHVGHYENQVEMDKVCLAHESFKVRYNATLFDSRCILIGEKFKPPYNFKSLPIWYPNVESCTDIDAQVKDLLSSLFWVLESKREVRIFHM